jgi:hypothetical protein
MIMNIKKIVSVFSILTMLIVMSCKDDDKLPLPFDKINNSNGAFMRVISVPSGSYDPFDLANSSFVIQLEAVDNKGGTLLKEYRFIVDFTDNSGGTIEKEPVLIKTVPASAFVKDATSGLPRTTVTITATEALAALGLSTNDVAPLDEFVFSQEMELIDGRIYSAANTSADVLGGAFYGAPFNTIVPLVCPVDGKLFLGNYLLSGTDSEFAEPVFSNAVVKLEVGAQPYQRVFSSVYLPDEGIGNAAQDWTINFICSTTKFPKQTTNLTCGSGNIALGPLNAGAYSETDDSSFTVTLVEGPDGDDGGCGFSGTGLVTLTFTKQ